MRLVALLVLAVVIGAHAVTWDATAILNKHNYERRAWGLTSLYSWDTRLAAGAQAYAQACTWGHSSYDHRGRDYASRKGVGFGGSYSECVGENLACNAGSSAINDNGWHNERQWWTCSSNTCASGKVCGHYTQVVWRNSIRLGCGATTCTTGSPFSSFSTWNILVCWYNPCGNFNNEHPLGGGHMCSYNPPIDCQVSAWSAWSTCTASCGGGSQSRTRSVTQSPSGGGAACPVLSESQSCNTHGCAVDCSWNAWSEWTSCSASCTPGGTRTRSRTQNAAQNGGAACTGSSTESQACNTDTPCPVDCTWNNWAEWSQCSASCEPGGTRTRSRTNNPAQNGGATCSGSATQSESCNVAVPCPVDCTWNAWTEWTTCSAECIPGGTRTRSRTQNAEQNGGASCTGDTNQSEACNTDTPCPVHCTWNAWSSWTACSAECAPGGTRTRTRTQNEPLHGGDACEGSATQSETCNAAVPCPVDCSWNAWSAWTTCDAECGGGEQNRTRTFNPAQNGGAACTGLATQYADCNTHNCPIDCTWNAWTAWSQCSLACGGGERNRSRTSNSEQFGGAPCSGSTTQTEACNTAACPVDCVWNNWSAYSACTEECGGGTQTRTRTKINEQNGGAPCSGPAEQTIACNETPCPIDCVWAPWSAWTQCDETCGGGEQTRSRIVQTPAANGGTPCAGDSTEACNVHACPVDCTWNNWSTWSACTETCGGGDQSRTRTQVAAANGGTACSGNTTETRACNTHGCPVDCSYGEWTVWGACSSTCTGGTQTRTRSHTEPLNGGAACTEPTSQIQNCNSDVVCPVDCQWNAWSAWTTCTEQCGGGVHTRNRTKVDAAGAGADCAGESSQNEPCNVHVCTKDCAWSAWSTWSECNKECGGGEQYRTRDEMSGTPDGLACTGDHTESRACNTVGCPVDCQVGAWGNWTTCTASCDGGTQDRIRPIIQPTANEGAACPALHESRSCNIQACEVGAEAVDCQVGEWSIWTVCSTNCAGGVQSHSREVLVAKANGGAECPTLYESRACNTGLCNETNILLPPEPTKSHETPSSEPDEGAHGNNAEDEDPITSDVAGIPMWSWIVIGIVALLLIVGAIVAIVLHKKKGSSDSPFSNKYYEMY